MLRLNALETALQTAKTNVERFSAPITAESVVTIAETYYIFLTAGNDEGMH